MAERKIDTKKKKEKKNSDSEKYIAQWSAFPRVSSGFSYKKLYISMNINI